MWQAIALAPWWAPAYADLAKVKEGLKDYEGAIHNLELYLLGSPKARDAQGVKDHIYVLEAKKIESAKS